MERAIALLALCLGCALSGCGVYRVMPPVGATVTVHGCYDTRGVAFFVEREGRCPDFHSATERVRRVEEKYGESLAGARVYIVDAYVECGGHDPNGCTKGLSSTVTDGPLVLRMVEHELSHQAINRKSGGSGSLREFDLDNPPHKRSERD